MNPRLALALVLLTGSTSLAAVDFAAWEGVLSRTEPILSGPASPARLEAMAEIHRITLELGDPAKANAEVRRRWFARLRERAQAISDPEVAYFLQTELRLDPAVAAFDVLDPRLVAKVPYRPGLGTEAALADVARSLDLGEPPRLTSDQLKSIATDPQLDAALTTRALVLLRRIDPAVAAPLLWSRMLSSPRRSDVLYWEEQIARLPVARVGATPYDAKASPAARAAWLRLAAVRPSLPVTSPDRAAWIALLRGPASELTEAAWDAAPRVFGAADRPELEAIAKDAPERVAARAAVALRRLR